LIKSTGGRMAAPGKELFTAIFSEYAKRLFGADDGISTLRPTASCFQVMFPGEPSIVMDWILAAWNLFEFRF
jgi:hypothetical protein